MSKGVIAPILIVHLYRDKSLITVRFFCVNGDCLAAFNIKRPGDGGGIRNPLLNKCTNAGLTTNAGCTAVSPTIARPIVSSSFCF